MLEELRVLNQKERAERYCARAQIAVEIASGATDRRIRDQFLIVADNWRRLAKTVESMMVDFTQSQTDISKGASDDLRR